MKRNNAPSSSKISLINNRPLPLWARVSYVVAAFVFVVAFCLFVDATLLRDTEQSLYNLRMTMRADYRQDAVRAAQKQIVLVPMSDETFDAANPIRIPVGPPPPRRFHAKVVDDLTQAGAKVIAFDIVFDAKRPDDKEFAAAVLRAAKRGTRVLWACLYENEANNPRFTQPNEQLRAASPYLGHIQVPQDVEKPFINSVSAVDVRTVGEQTRAIPSLGLRAALLMVGIKNLPRRAKGGWKVGSVQIPVNSEGHFAITYFGKPNDDNGGGVFASVPYEDVYDGIATDPFYQANRFFQDKIVVIGDTTTLGNDVRYSPMGSMAGMEIQAHAMATALAALKWNEPFLKEMPFALNAAAIAFCAALSCLFTFRWRLFPAVLSTVLIIIGYGLFNLWLFVEHSLYFHLIAPLLSIVLCSSVVMLGRTVWEEREKNRAKGLLQRYVSPAVADFVMNHPERCNLGGEEIEATVLFCDVRDSTRLCKEVSPQVMLGLLNEFFQEMSEVVFLHEGTVDKFIGDAIMVLFGALVSQADHAQRAVAAALDMSKRMERLQEKLRAEGRPLLRCGISISSGPMIVGNMGSERRMDFSVLGNAVNMASRFEGLNKRWGTTILIAEETYNLLTDKSVARGPVVTPLRGSDTNVTVYVVENGQPHSAPVPLAENRELDSLKDLTAGRA